MPRHLDCEEGKKSGDHPGSSLCCCAIVVTTQLPVSAPQARSDLSCEPPSRTWFKTALAAWDPLGPPRAAYTGLHTQHFAGTTGPTCRNVYPTLTCPMEGKGVSSSGTPSPFWHPARGQRIGEASHPGPRPRICDASLIHPAQASIQDSTCLLCLDEVSPLNCMSTWDVCIEGTDPVGWRRPVQPQAHNAGCVSPPFNGGRQPGQNSPLLKTPGGFVGLVGRVYADEAPGP